MQSLTFTKETEKVPYSFAFQSTTSSDTSTVDVLTDLYNSLLKPGLLSSEDLLHLHYTPLAVFRVKPVTRCTSAIAGHGQAILATQFSPANSSLMVSGSGDGTARIWDCDTGTPAHTLKGHTSWVLAVAFSPDGTTIATGSMDNTLRLWDAKTGAAKGGGGPLKGHTKWITALAWEPIHLQQPGRPRLVSSSKDATCRVWDVVSGRVDATFTRHTSTVSCVKWGGAGTIFSSSHDKTVKVWDPTTGAQLANLTSHAHWVNHLALSTDFVLRTGYFDHTSTPPATPEAGAALARSRWEKAAATSPSSSSSALGERLVTASDDCTIFLWDTLALSKPIARLLGHQKQVNHVTFSPDGRLIASCGFDNHVKLWRASDGKFLRTLRGHVGPVYQCCFSADSRLLVSASKDTTLKAWDVASGVMVEDLPGHKDEVFAVDWSCDGRRVGSGGKDKAVRLWSH